jgi:hypothetical protein
MSSIATTAVMTDATIDAITGTIIDVREGIAFGGQFAVASGDMAGGIGDAGGSVFGATGRSYSVRPRLRPGFRFRRP